MLVARHLVLVYLYQLRLGVGQDVPYSFIGRIALQLNLRQFDLFSVRFDYGTFQASFCLCQAVVADHYPFYGCFNPVCPALVAGWGQ